MEKALIISYLQEKNIKFYLDFPIYELSSFEVGGLADVFVAPSTLNELCEILIFLNRYNFKYSIIGNCTNTFFSDNAYNGVIVSTKQLNKVEINGNIISAMCGALISDCSILAINRSLSGLEFACGIPGTVGGALFMNSSAFNHSVSDIVLESKVFNLKSGKTSVLTSKEHLFDKKQSIFSLNRENVLLETKFLLSIEKNKNLVYTKTRENVFKRIYSQPIEFGNCGSAFKRPKNYYASKLIDQAKLKGTKIGGAEVSKKHAGFIVNSDNATSKNILDLMGLIKSRVYDEFHVSLEEEILFME